jgi:sirohydrochlorin ferrochelatase
LSAAARVPRLWTQSGLRTILISSLSLALPPVTPVYRIAALALVCSIAACATPRTPGAVTPPDDSMGSAQGAVGILVMAHGGDDAWNRTVNEAVAGLPETVPVELAYGMANPFTLRAALDRLADQGVERVALVRAFLSGHSFLDQTRWYLGLADQPPAEFVLMGPAAADPAARAALDHEMDVATHAEGVLDSPLAGEIMADRALEVSVDPTRESVLLLAHGMGDDGENDLVLAAMDRIARQVQEIGFADVRSETLREDWEEVRVHSEARIRAYVESRGTAGERVLVLPVRLTGFGPYSQVLEGLDYTEGRGLMPHARMGDWILDTANTVSCTAGWGPVVATCARAVVAPESALRR